jgi:hypothetical protein
MSGPKQAALMFALYIIVMSELPLRPPRFKTYMTLVDAENPAETPLRPCSAV